MKRQGKRIVRYADDILLFARTYQEARKDQHVATEFLEQELNRQ